MDLATHGVLAFKINCWNLLVAVALLKLHVAGYSIIERNSIVRDEHHTVRHAHTTIQILVSADLVLLGVLINVTIGWYMDM